MAIGPDGERIAALLWGATVELWLFDLRQGRRQRLVEGEASPSRCGRRTGPALIYGAPAPGGTDPTRLVRHRLSGVEPEVMLEGGPVWPSDWSRDGRWIAYVDWVGGGSDIWLWDAESGGEPQSYARTPANEWGPAFSPDGDWIVYTSDESGQYEIYLARFPWDGERHKVSAHGNSEEPQWSPDGSEIYYRNGNRWWAVPIQLEPDVAVGRPRLVLEGPYLNVAGISWDLHPDGERLLVIDVPRETTVGRIHVIPNWVSEVARLVPIG